MIDKIKELLKKQRENCADAIVCMPATIISDEEPIEVIMTAPEPEINLWISVEERLPEEEKEYIVLFCQLSMSGGTYIQRVAKYHSHIQRFQGEFDLIRAAYWTELLPLPPKPETKQ